jgi:hypothetical protein
LSGIAIGIARAQQTLAALRVEGVAAPKGARVPATPRPAPAPVIAAQGVTGPQQRILNALAWWKAFGIAQPTNEQAYPYLTNPPEQLR